MGDLQNRIMAVLEKPDVLCVWPVRRAIDRLWIDDTCIPSRGVKLAFALWRLKKRRMIICHDGYIGKTQ